MLRSLKHILRYRTHAKDGELGRVSDFYFDEGTWRIRHLVLQTGNWLFEREVLLPPAAAGEPDWEQMTVPVALTLEQVRSCPPIEADLPVSRQKEIELARHYQIAPYWEPVGPSVILTPPRPVLEIQDKEERKETELHGDPRLRSARDVMGYRIHATDADLGHVSDFLVQTDGWAIRYLVVDVSRWLTLRKVLISPAWVSAVEWNERRVFTDMTAEQVRGSLPFHPEAPVNREYEARLYDYYGRPKYWEHEASPRRAAASAAATGGQVEELAASAGKDRGK